MYRGVVSGFHKLLRPVRFCSTRSVVVDTEFVKFQLFDVLNAEATLFEKGERFQHVTPDIVTEALSTAKKIAEEKFLPHHRKSDLMEPKWDPKSGVQIIPEVKEALGACRDAGFLRLFF